MVHYLHQSMIYTYIYLGYHLKKRLPHVLLYTLDLKIFLKISFIFFSKKCCQGKPSQFSTTIGLYFLAANFKWKDVAELWQHTRLPGCHNLCSRHHLQHRQHPRPLSQGTNTDCCYWQTLGRRSCFCHSGQVSHVSPQEILIRLGFIWTWSIIYFNNE